MEENMNHKISILIILVMAGLHIFFYPAGLYCEEIKRDVEKYNLAASELRSEENTSELQSHSDLVCRLLLEKKK